MSDKSDDNHLKKKDLFFFYFFWNRTDYRGFPSKGYSVFFLTEYNRKLGSALFQKSSTNVVRTNCFPGVKFQKNALNNSGINVKIKTFNIIHHISL